MAKRSRGSGERPGSHGSQRPSVRAGSIRQAEDAVGDVAETGRPGSGSRVRSDEYTERSGTAGGAPGGSRTVIPPKDDAEVRRSLQMENSGAVVLADKGWQIKQNPSVDEVAQARVATGDRGDPRKNPDYLLEGRVFDAYSPTTPPATARWGWNSRGGDREAPPWPGYSWAVATTAVSGRSSTKPQPVRVSASRLTKV